MPTSTSLRRLLPGYLALTATAIFGTWVGFGPHLGPQACMESYPMQCPIVELDRGALVGTLVALVCVVVAIFLACGMSKPTPRAVTVGLGFLVLFAVMVVGASLSLSNTIEVRY